MRILFLSFIFLFKTICTNAQTVFNDSIAPQLEFTDWINNPKGMAVTENKPVILEFWSTWCKPCIESLPHLNKLTEQYNDDVTFISVNSYEDRDKVETFLLKHPMLSYVALDEDKTLMKAFKAETFSTTILIDKHGRIRWKGLAEGLTDDLLNTFLEKDTVYDTYYKGLIHQQNYTITTPDTIHYTLTIEYGDITKGKSVTTDYENRFLFKFSNYNIYALLNAYSRWFKLGNDWKFKNTQPKEHVLNVSIESDVEINDSNIEKRLIEDVILKLADHISFTISTNIEAQDIWYIVPDPDLLKAHRSKDQNADIKTVEYTEDYTVYKHVFFAYLADSFSKRTKEKVKYDSSQPFFTYNLTIPNTNNIFELKRYLKDEYGIDLIKKKVDVPVKTVSFN